MCNRGSVAQAVGWALYERTVFDEEGRVVNPTFRNYRIPAFADTPRTEELSQAAGVVLDMMRQISLPGFVNDEGARATDACMPTPAYSGREDLSLQAGSSWNHSRGPPLEFTGKSHPHP